MPNAKHFWNNTLAVSFLLIQILYLLYLLYIAVLFDLLIFRSLHGVSWLVSCKSFLGRIPCCISLASRPCLCVRAIL
jgi:hypothetical protein